MLAKWLHLETEAHFAFCQKRPLIKVSHFMKLLFLLLLLPGFYELTRLIYLCSCRNCLTRIYILQIIMQARGHYSKLNFTFLRFPLSQRSISLQNDIGWTSSCTLSRPHQNISDQPIDEVYCAYTCKNWKNWLEYWNFKCLDRAQVFRKFNF